MCEWRDAIVEYTNSAMAHIHYDVAPPDDTRILLSLFSSRDRDLIHLHLLDKIGIYEDMWHECNGNANMCLERLSRDEKLRKINACIAPRMRCGSVSTLNIMDRRILGSKRILSSEL